MSWEQLLAIGKEAKEMREQDDAQPLVACPVCGAVLDKNSQGEKNCPLGHFRAPPGATYGSHGR